MVIFYSFIVFFISTNIKFRIIYGCWFARFAIKVGEAAFNMLIMTFKVPTWWLLYYITIIRIRIN